MWATNAVQICNFKFSSNHIKKVQKDGGELSLNNIFCFIPSIQNITISVYDTATFQELTGPVGVAILLDSAALEDISWFRCSKVLCLIGTSFLWDPWFQCPGGIDLIEVG